MGEHINGIVDTTTIAVADWEPSYHPDLYFNWTYHVNPPNQEACCDQLLQGGSNTNASGK
eukprot:1760876-Ditylum_brightwellii.AAC.1